MKINMVGVGQLKPYANNPRKNDNAVEMVAESIKSFGFKVPIIIDKNNEIIAGHTRLKAAMLLNMEEVPCIVADDLTKEQIKAFRIADNKVSEFAEWDWQKLEIEIEDIKLFTGFGQEEIQSFDIESVEQEFGDFEDIGKKKKCPHCGEYL